MKDWAHRDPSLGLGRGFSQRAPHPPQRRQASWTEVGEAGRDTPSPRGSVGGPP